MLVLFLLFVSIVSSQNSFGLEKTTQLTFASNSASVSSEGLTFWAGGNSLITGKPTDLVRIYDGRSGNWSNQRLSEPRSGLAATSLGYLVFFGGGFAFGNGTESDIVDIYDIASTNWTIGKLDKPISFASATSTTDKVIFAGIRGVSDDADNIFGNCSGIDIYDVQTRNWTYSYFPMSYNCSSIKITSVDDLVVIVIQSTKSIVFTFDAISGNFSFDRKLYLDFSKEPTDLFSDDKFAYFLYDKKNYTSLIKLDPKNLNYTTENIPSVTKGISYNHVLILTGMYQVLLKNDSHVQIIPVNDMEQFEIDPNIAINAGNILVSTFTDLFFFSYEMCDPGTFSLDGKNNCTLCPGGTFSSSVASLECIGCNPGYYSSAGSLSCLLCDSGMYNPNANSSSCQLCPKGSITTPSRINCKECNAGYYAFDDETCKACSPGYYTTDSIQCYPCQPGYYNDVSANSQCKQCVDAK